MQEFVVDIPRDEWWTQNRRGHWRVKFAHTSAVKQRAMAFARFWLQNGHHRPQHFPVHVTAIIHPLTHGRFDPENAAPMVKAILDALTDTGFWPDDDSKHIIGPDYRGGEPSIRKGWVPNHHPNRRRGTLAMATNVTEKDKTLNEIIDWAKSRCHEAGLSRFDVRRKSDRDFYDGQVNAFHEMLELCRSMLGYTGSMQSEVPNQNEDAK